MPGACTEGKGGAQRSDPTAPRLSIKRSHTCMWPHTAPKKGLARLTPGISGARPCPLVSSARAPRKLGRVHQKASRLAVTPVPVPRVLTRSQRDPEGDPVVRGEGRGAQAEGAHGHAGDGGEGEDGEEHEGAGEQQRQPAVERDGHGEQRVGEQPETEGNPAGSTRTP